MAAFLHLPVVPVASYTATAAAPVRVLVASTVPEPRDRPGGLIAFWSLADDDRPLRAWRFSGPSTPH